MEPTQNRVLSFSEGCQYLGYKKSYVYKLTSARVLPFSKPNGKKIFFDRDKLEAWMLSNASSSATQKQIEASTYISTVKNTKRKFPTK
jgi:excisionase family DNA binding protein